MSAERNTSGIFALLLFPNVKFANPSEKNVEYFNAQ